MKFLLQLAFKFCDFLINENCCEGQHIAGNRMLQLLKIVFTFGNELLSFVPKNERQRGKQRVLESQTKYWIGNFWKKHEHFLVQTNFR